MASKQLSEKQYIDGLQEFEVAKDDFFAARRDVIACTECRGAMFVPGEPRGGYPTTTKCDCLKRWIPKGRALMRAAAKIDAEDDVKDSWFKLHEEER